MSYAPRGNVKLILDTMATKSSDLEWTAQELADIAGIEKLTVSSTLRCAVQHEAVFATRKGREFAYSLTPYEPATEEEGEASEFNAAMWLDGELIVYGVPQNEDGSFTLTKEQVTQVKQLITWSAAQ